MYVKLNYHFVKDVKIITVVIFSKHLSPSIFTSTNWYQRRNNEEIVLQNDLFFTKSIQIYSYKARLKIRKG
jgi:hypothetical protein